MFNSERTNANNNLNGNDHQVYQNIKQFQPSLLSSRNDKLLPELLAQKSYSQQSKYQSLS